MIVGLGLGIAASSHFTVSAAAEVIRVKKGVVAVGNAQIDTAQSKFGGSSALFDGTGDYLLTNYNTNQTGDFTIECWTRFNTIASTQSMWIFGNNDIDAIQLYLYTTANEYQYKLRMDIWNRVGVFSSITVSANTWYHLAVVRSGSTLTLYIDGTNRGTMSRSGTIGNGGNLRVGQGSWDMNGWIDEFRFSDFARYTANFTPSTTPLQNDDNTVLLLHMDGTDGSTVFTDDNGVPPDYDYGS